MTATLFPLRQLPRAIFPAVATVLSALFLPVRAAAQIPAELVAPFSADQCSSCAGWNTAQHAFRIYGNTYWVGTRGLGAILITSPAGHVLIDGALPNSAPLILRNVEALGFRASDIRIILNSHAHFDHAGGIAALKAATGARVMATAQAADAIETGITGSNDPQAGIAFPFPGAGSRVGIVGDGEVIRLGEIRLTANLTAGHTPGGTSWSWESCYAGRCLTFVYADSLTPVSGPDFRYSDSSAYPTALTDFEAGFRKLDQMKCDILITPHPDASSMWERLEGGLDSLVDAGACRRYADNGRSLLSKRLETEAADAR